jgi:GT2 family glycosyltransferase
MIPDVSIVLSCFNRAKQLEKTLESIRLQSTPAEVIIVEDGCDGKTQYIAKNFGAKYFRRNRAELPVFQNPARVHNIGIRRATGRVVVLQGGEVMFETKPNGLRDLISPVLKDSNVATTPIVQSLDRHGKFQEMYCAPSGCPRASWIVNFCLAVDRNKLLEVGGFEESYWGYGFEDDQLVYSLRKIGVVPRYVPEVLTSHQWHDRSLYDTNQEYTKAQFTEFVRQVEVEGRLPVANDGLMWGLT